MRSEFRVNCAMHAPSYRHTAERVVGPREPQFHTRSPTPQPPAWPVEPGAMLLAAVHDGTRCCADQAPTPGRAGGLQPGGAPPTAQPPAPDGLAAAHAPSRAAPSDGPLATDALTWLACASANGLYGDASPHAPHEPARRVGRKPKSISFEAVVTTFDLPIEHAARVLGVCTTVVKKLCRANGVLRWPYRKLSSRAGAAATRADGAARCSLAAGGRNVSICLGSGEVVRNEDVLVRWEVRRTVTAAALLPRPAIASRRAWEPARSAGLPVCLRPTCHPLCAPCSLTPRRIHRPSRVAPALRPPSARSARAQRAGAAMPADGQRHDLSLIHI